LVNYFGIVGQRPLDPQRWERERERPTSLDRFVTVGKRLDLTPALSSQERENRSPLDWNIQRCICQTIIRKTRTAQMLFLLPGGEG
jgi:hypothetical protein